MEPTETLHTTGFTATASALNLLTMSRAERIAAMKAIQAASTNR